MPLIPLFQMPDPDEPEPEDDQEEGLADDPINLVVPGEVAFYGCYSGRAFGDIERITTAHTVHRHLTAAGVQLTPPHRLAIKPVNWS